MLCAKDKFSSAITISFKLAKNIDLNELTGYILVDFVCVSLMFINKKSSDS